MHCNVSWAVFTEVVTCGGLADLTTKETKRYLICSSELLSSSPHTAGRADLVKWALEDFQSKLDIMQPRVS